MTYQPSSDAGLVTGEYYLDHQLVTYQSQGQENGIDLQYSSAQADPTPVVQYQFTTPPAGDSAAITSITAQVSLAGVIQGPATTYNTPGGLQDGDNLQHPPPGERLVAGHRRLPLHHDHHRELRQRGRRGDLTSTDQGYVNIVNETSDPLGAGWSVGGLQKVSQLTSDGPVLITAGQQGTEQFDPVYTEGQTNLQDLGLATSTSLAQILANDGTGDFSGSTASATDKWWARPPATSTATASQTWPSSARPRLAIQLNNGTGGFTAGNSYAIPSGYKAKAVAVGNFSGHSDGTLDIAVLLCLDQHECLLRSPNTPATGAGGFATPVISAAATASPPARSPTPWPPATSTADGGDRPGLQSPTTARST